MKQELLRLRVVRMLAGGQLPPAGDTTVVVEFGEGSCCDICAEPIIEAEVQYEVRDSTHRCVRAHLQCFNAWQRAAEDVRLVRHR